MVPGSVSFLWEELEMDDDFKTFTMAAALAPATLSASQAYSGTDRDGVREDKEAHVLPTFSLTEAKLRWRCGTRTRPP